MSLVTVYKTFSPADAQLIRSMLEAADVPATVAHELSALSLDGYALAAGGIAVQVPEDRVDFARELITTSAPPSAE
ncbi:MAG TPA: DUF2007 domain-containing protein [Verrucomicrobiae bacterium]|nr:DUF2007 domain-containing protein [Verrucomicrobiae bacterium]